MTGFAPITMFGPDFPFAYDDWLAHPAGLGELPAARLGARVAVIGGGVAGVVAAYELMRLGLRPVLYELSGLGGRMRSARFGVPGAPVAELGAMRFPPSATTLFHYIGLTGLRTTPFPNPLAPPTPATLVDLNGEQHLARTPADLPPLFQDVHDAWHKALGEQADLPAMLGAIQRRDVPTIKVLWNRLVAELDDQSFHGFLASSPAFPTFRHRELFGQVGFGTGGWDTDFTHSMLEILRVVFTAADEDHVGVAGGCQQLPEGLWDHPVPSSRYWPAGTSLASLHPAGPRPAVSALRRDADGIRVETATGAETFPTVVWTPQVRMLLTGVDCAEELLPTSVWTAVERVHYMPASKLFVATDRPFWHDRDPHTGRAPLAMTLTDRAPRSMYLFDDGPDRPGVICLSYTWNDDSAKVARLPVGDRLTVLLRRLSALYPGVDLRGRIIGEPIAVSWESELGFVGAFKQNLPGHYRYQRRLYAHFVQDSLADAQRGLFLAGDDISWTGGFAEGAVTTALNAVWGVLRHLGGATVPGNPGPGDVWSSTGPVSLPDP